MSTETTAPVQSEAPAESAASRFPQPSAEMASHAFRKLEWNDRLVGYKMTASMGNMATDLYGLQDAVIFLVGTRWDRITPHSHKATFNWIELADLTAWLRDVVGDEDLAKAIDAEAVPLGNYRAQSEKVAEIVAERMAQYQEVLQKPEADDGRVDA